MTLAIAVHTARRLGEIGFLVGAIGGLLLLVEGMTSAGSGRSNPMRALAGLLMAAGFVLGIAYVHWG
jgi:hypothetical protein